MKPKKPETPETPAPGLIAAHAALVVVLDQFNIPLATFLRQPTVSYEHRVAAHSLDDLIRLYYVITQPGIRMEDAARQCPVWPSGRYTGQQPDARTLCRIKKRLLPRLASTPPRVSRETPDEMFKRVLGRNPFKNQPN